MASSEVIYSSASVPDGGACYIVMKGSALARITPLSRNVEIISTAIIAEVCRTSDVCTRLHSRIADQTGEAVAMHT